jgi:hypothetical protein
MQDIFFLALVIAFFALAAGMIRICEKIICPDELDLSQSHGQGEPPAGGPAGERRRAA